jgi:hypothetical protein
MAKRALSSINSFGRSSFFRKRPRAQSSSFFLAFPVEIRLDIYQVMLEDSFASGHWGNDTHPLYPLLFVNQFLRLEISAIIYKSPSLKFDSAQKCLFFLKWTSAHVHSLRSLRISVPPNDTYPLESVFRFLLEKQTPLEKLALDFLDINCIPLPSPSKNMASLAKGQDALFQARGHARKLNNLFNKELDPDYEYFPQHLKPKAHLAKDNRYSSLGQIKTLRCLSIIGMPSGDWATEFELGALRLHAQMFEIAAAEGKMMIVKDPSNRTQRFKNVSYDPRGFWTFNWMTTKWFSDTDYWINNEFWIEGTKSIQSEDEVAHLRRYCLERPPVLETVKATSLTPSVTWMKKLKGKVLG